MLISIPFLSLLQKDGDLKGKEEIEVLQQDVSTCSSLSN